MVKSDWGKSGFSYRWAKVIELPFSFGLSFSLARSLWFIMEHVAFGTVNFFDEVQLCQASSASFEYLGGEREKDWKCASTGSIGSSTAFSLALIEIKVVRSTFQSMIDGRSVSTVHDSLVSFCLRRKIE